MAIDSDIPVAERGDEAYFEVSNRQRPQGFDARLLQEPLTVLPTRRPIVFGESDTVSEAMRAMQSEHRGVVLVTEDGSALSRLTGVFTERDVLNRVIDRGRNPTKLALCEVMTLEPEALPVEASVAWVLNKMCVGGFRHVPVVDGSGRPTAVVSVRDVVQFLVEAFPSEVLNLPPEYGDVVYPTREGA
ncbi:MAG: CBS domain-containing protein [Proteobacteria bacterium]|nr:CBS domain-containing protein [Pseudomonadota bacterium]